MKKHLTHKDIITKINRDRRGKYKKDSWRIKRNILIALWVSVIVLLALVKAGQNEKVSASFTKEIANNHPLAITVITPTPIYVTQVIEKYPETFNIKDFAKQKVMKVWNNEKEWTAFDYIVQHESGWQINVENHSCVNSGHTDCACTLMQINPCSKYINNGYKRGDINDELSAGINYIKSRYGDPIKAQEFWKIHNYY